MLEGSLAFANIAPSFFRAPLTMASSFTSGFMMLPRPREAEGKLGASAAKVVPPGATAGAAIERSLSGEAMPFECTLGVPLGMFVCSQAVAEDAARGGFLASS